MVSERAWTTPEVGWQGAATGPRGHAAMRKRVTKEKMFLVAREKKKTSTGLRLKRAREQAYLAWRGEGWVSELVASTAGKQFFKIKTS